MQIIKKKRKIDLPTVQFRVTEDQKIQIEDLAHAERTSIQALMEEAVSKIFTDRNIATVETPILRYARQHPAERRLLDDIVRILESEDDMAEKAAKGPLRAIVASGIYVLDSLQQVREAEKPSADVT